MQLTPSSKPGKKAASTTSPWSFYHTEIAKKHIQYDKMTKVMIGDKEAVQKQVEKQKAMKKTF